MPFNGIATMNHHLIRIALVIPVHNRREITLQCLRSLSRIDVSGLSVRIFIVDDGSTDETSDSIRQYFPDVELISGDGKLHYAGGTNRGIEAALEWDPDFVVTMNDDAVFHDQFLKRLVETAIRNPHSIVGALLLLWSEPHRVFQVGQVWHTWKGGWDIPTNLTAFNVPPNAFEVECIVGNCVLFPVQAIRECGLMDERSFQYGWGDAQYIARLRKRGWATKIEPRAFVWCEPNTYPPPLHSLSAREVLKILFFDQKHPLNLQRQFMAVWESAPSKLQAAIAFAVFCGRLLLKSVMYGARNLLITPRLIR